MLCIYSRVFRRLLCLNISMQVGMFMFRGGGPIFLVGGSSGQTLYGIWKVFKRILKYICYKM